jgi:hypothetical protein
MFRKLIPLLIVITILATACGFRVDIPVKTPGPEITDEISIPIPAGEQIRLKVSFGAGELSIGAGSDELVSGTVTYNIDDLKPETITTGSTIELRQGSYTLNGIPYVANVVNNWDLELGSIPIDLEIDAGAYHAEYDFGGLALTNLTIQDGASDVELAFSSPNQAEMSLLRYETGASNVTLNGLSNANFSSMEFDCGAGNYTLDFTGQLKRSATISIEAGLGNVTLVIPEGISAVVSVESGLSNVSFPAGWEKSGNVYTQSGSGPTLTFIVEIGAGNLSIRH